ncbi:MAG: hypothetical protein NVS9B2_30670 [Steroidobacteraceae bacterium]
MEPDADKGKIPNLATTLASIAIDAMKLVTSVALDYPDPLLTPLVTVPQPAKEDLIMDDVKDDKDTPLVDKMTDVVADAVGELAKTAVKAVAKRAKKARRIQTVVATAAIVTHDSNSSSASAGVFQPSVFLGRALRVAATADMSSALWMLRSVPFGKYCRSNPLVFSLVPRCQGLCGSQK